MLFAGFAPFVTNQIPRFLIYFPEKTINLAPRSEIMSPKIWAFLLLLSIIFRHPI